MKKTARICTTFVMVAVMLLALAIPASANGFDFETAEKSFNSTPVNTFELNVDDQKTLVVAWQGYSCYTSDNSIIEISDNAVVTAIGEGTAYAAIVMSDNVYMLYRFDVVSAIAEDDDYKTIGAITSENDDAASDTTNNTSSKSTFEEKVEEHEKIFEEETQKMMSEYEERSESIFETFGIFAGIILAIGIGGIVVFVYFVKKQNKPSGKTIICPTCNAVQPYGTDVCQICGSKLGE